MGSPSGRGRSASDEDMAQICFGYGMFTGALGLHNGLEKVGAAVVPSSTGIPRAADVYEGF